jgi:hypothetical protein
VANEFKYSMQGPDLVKTWKLLLNGKSMINYANDMLNLNTIKSDKSMTMVAV